MTLQEIEAITEELRAATRELDAATLALAHARGHALAIDRALLAAMREANPFPVGCVVAVDADPEHDDPGTLARVYAIVAPTLRTIEYPNGDIHMLDTAALTYSDRAWEAERST